MQRVDEQIYQTGIIGSQFLISNFWSWISNYWSWKYDYQANSLKIYTSVDASCITCPSTCPLLTMFYTLRPRQNGRHFPDDIFKCIFLTEDVWISIEISLKFVAKGKISNIPSLFQIMAWHRPGDKPLSELMMVSLLTHICVTRPQWVNMFIERSFEHKVTKFPVVRRL